MYIESFKLRGIRSFYDSGDITLGRKCNIFVGRNNTGKSTLLRTLLAFQGFPFQSVDFRPGIPNPYIQILVADILKGEFLLGKECVGKALITRTLMGPPSAVVAPPGAVHFQASENCFPA